MKKNQTWIQDELNNIKNSGLWRSLRTITTPQAEHIAVKGKDVINLCSNNYLGLANDIRLKNAAIDAIKKYGCSGSASRLICGNNILYDILEERLADFLGQEKAVVFNSGYHANLGIIPLLAGKNGIIFSDKLNHASIIDGIKLSRKKSFVYSHINTESLKKEIESAGEYDRGVIITESVFSMDGDRAPLKKINTIADQKNLMMMVDEAHAIGVMGENGRGYVNEEGLSKNVTAIMGTMGKAMGSFGSFICGSKELIDLIINRARSLIFTTALPPSVLASAIEAIKIMESDKEPFNNLWSNINFFTKELKLLGFNLLNSSSPIIPIIIGDNNRTMEFCQRLLSCGVLIQGIRPPTVPEGTSRMRITLMATHTKKDLEISLEALKSVGREFGII